PPPSAGDGPSPSPRPLSGGRVVVSGLVAGTAALAIALFLRAVVAHTPVRVSAYTLYWCTVLAGSFGVVAGMAVEAVSQLRRNNPDPAYHATRRLRRPPRQPGDQG
ncbi:MAG: hypothetical protein ACK41W_15550, partial [Cyanobacteriota bacterium]